MPESLGLQENIIANYFQKCYNSFKKSLPKNRPKAQNLSVNYLRNLHVSYLWISS